MWEKACEESTEQWLEIQSTAKCVVRVFDGGIYWSKYDEVPNRNLIETIMYHDGGVTFEKAEGPTWEGYIKVLTAEDIKDELPISMGIRDNH